MKIEIKGTLTSGYYNDMEAGYPVFINGDSLSEVVKDELTKMGLDNNFCYGPDGDDSDVSNPLKGRKVTLTLDIEEPSPALAN